MEKFKWWGLAGPRRKGKEIQRGREVILEDENQSKEVFSVSF